MPILSSLVFNNKLRTNIFTAGAYKSQWKDTSFLHTSIQTGIFFQKSSKITEVVTRSKRRPVIYRSLCSSTIESILYESIEPHEFRYF